MWTQPLSPHTFSRYFLCQELGPQQHTGQNGSTPFTPKACLEQGVNQPITGLGATKELSWFQSHTVWSSPVLTLHTPTYQQHPLQAPGQAQFCRQQTSSPSANVSGFANG
ncbi:hypothetical protein D623_10030890 [Myotis brandtii]|uniref:Uncharacterized protein n=1 Tax=Myotis brandtii TaxID=109478 RepID=S7MTI2_MYOBR|nr:hypothetical protein D623_10030890 [Myotis brandtii]